MKETNILVIGGGPAAVITSTVAAQMNAGKSVTVVRAYPDVPIPCGIPYAYGQLKGIENNLMPDAPYTNNKIELIIDEALNGNLAEKWIELKSGQKIKYEKLVLATGSNPVIPKSIQGYDKPGVWLVKKDNNYLREIYKAKANVKNVVIIGAGFIGMEFADELVADGKNISIVEMLDHPLIAALDPEFCTPIEERIKKAGVKLYLNRKVKAILGQDKVEAVELEDGEKIPAEMVIVAIGAKPNTELAEKLGLAVGKNGIWVDEYMRTSNVDVFAVGDCAEKIDFFTRRPTYVMLASTACAESRVAGANLYSLQVVRENKGTIGVFSTSIQGLTVATAGLTETAAKKHGFDVICSTTASPDRHPGKFSDTSDLKVKLIFSKSCGVLLGGQVMGGGKSAGEMINAIGIAIQKRMTVSELFTLQFGTHPLLTAAPTTYPLITAAQSVLVQLKKSQAQPQPQNK